MVWMIVRYLFKGIEPLKSTIFRLSCPHLGSFMPLAVDYRESATVSFTRIEQFRGPARKPICP
jgi:hypothetical protein